MPRFRLILSVFALCLCAAGGAAAQDVRFELEPGRAEAGEEMGEFEDPWEEHLETDRDSFTPATTTVGARRLLVESAYSFIDNRTRLETHSYPELIVRYGLSERFEARIGWNYEVGGAGNSISGAGGEVELDERARLERESTLSYGMKVALTSQRGLVPRSVWLAQGFTPTSGPDPASQFFTSVTAGWELPRRWQVDTALRYATASEREDHFNLWSPSTVLRVPLGRRWNVHGEYFGIFSQGKGEPRREHYFSTGPHYLITPDLEVGVRVGWGLNEQAANFFSNAGFGWRY